MGLHECMYFILFVYYAYIVFHFIFFHYFLLIYMFSFCLHVTSALYELIIIFFCIIKRF